jgi:hypothetical protein
MRELLGWMLMLLLWVVAIGIPVVVHGLFGTPAGVIAGVAVPALWVSVLPSTCMSGGFGMATLGTTQLLYGIAWLVFGVVHGLGYLWGRVVG